MKLITIQQKAGIPRKMTYGEPILYNAFRSWQLLKRITEITRTFYATNRYTQEEQK